MGKMFYMEGPIMGTLSKIADLAILNIITLICCIPVFTIGASLTAMNYVLLKMVRREEGYIVRTFFKSFRQNFKQATISWICMLVIVTIMITDLRIISSMEGNLKSIMLVFLFMIAIIFGVTVLYFFPVLSRYENTLVNSVKNSFLLSMIHLPKTIVMVIITGGCLILYYRFFYRVLPIMFLFGYTLPGYINMILFSKVFQKLDGQSAQENE